MLHVLLLRNNALKLNSLSYHQQSMHYILDTALARTLPINDQEKDNSLNDVPFCFHLWHCLEHLFQQRDMIIMWFLKKLNTIHKHKPTMFRFFVVGPSFSLDGLSSDSGYDACGMHANWWPFWILQSPIHTFINQCIDRLYHCDVLSIWMVVHCI